MSLAVDEQEADPQSQLHYVRDLIAWRREHDVMRIGTMGFINTPDSVISFARTLGDVAVHCLFNLGSQAINLPHNIASGSVRDYAPGSAKLTDNNMILLPAHGFVVATI